MPETPAPAEPGPHARFPWAPALLCAASLAMAGWTWMMYSYCWRMTPGETLQPVGEIEVDLWVSEAYVELDCREQEVFTEKVFPSGAKRNINFSGFPLEPGHQVRRGRWSPYIMTLGYPRKPQSYEVTITLEAASRFHPASVAGLVVGAFGTFVFALYLRQWMKERRNGTSAAACRAAYPLAPFGGEG